MVRPVIIKAQIIKLEANSSRKQIVETSLDTDNINGVKQSNIIILKDTSISFMHLLDLVHNENVPFIGSDTDIVFYDFDFNCNTTPFYLEKHFLQQLKSIPKYFLSDTGYYCTSRLNVIRGMDIDGIPIIFYMQGGWEKSRSLVFAVFDSLGNEISSKILVTDDCSIDAYKDSNKWLYKHSIYNVNISSIDIIVFSGGSYEDKKYTKSYLKFQVSKNGKITEI